MRWKNPLTRNYDCHCGARFATVCRFRHWVNDRNELPSGARAFIIAMLFLTWASGAPNRLNGCKAVDDDVDGRWDKIEESHNEAQKDLNDYVNTR